ncbi:MAG: hypothetical protein PUA82_05455 [Eubacteriales bacterium]|nr:hypothetical protein [Eubacteriales bacterium]
MPDFMIGLCTDVLLDVVTDQQKERSQMTKRRIRTFSRAMQRCG